MNITEVSIMPHVGFVLLLLRLYSAFVSRDPIPYFMSFLYLTWIHRDYVKAFQKKMELANQKQSEEREIGRQREHRVFVPLFLLWFLSALNFCRSDVYFIFFLHLYRVLADSEILRLLNYVIEKLWPVCMEEYASKKIFQPTVDWFLEKHKESTLKKALVQCLCLGSNPPTFTEVHVFRNSDEDDGWVIEVGINFCADDHMRSILAIKLRDRLGQGMWVKLDMKNLYVDGKVLIMVNFLNHWPFVRRVQVCFVEPPHFSMAVKPLFTCGLDVMEPPVIVLWLDKLLSTALKKMLVWPSALMFDVEKYASTCPESCFSLNAEEPDACVRVGAITTSGLKPPWFLVSVDWYVKVRLGNCIFRSSTQRTQSPSWDEEFRIPVTWELRDKIRVEVCYKGFLFDKTYGWSSLDINAVRDGRTRSRRLRLSNKERQYLRLSVTVLKSNEDSHLPNEHWFSLDEVKPVGYAKVEVIEALVSKRSTAPGSINPYVEGQMEPYRFHTRTLYKTEAPKWLEEFNIPIRTLKDPNRLYMEVRDKHYFRDGYLGSCSFNVNDAGDGHRHDIWMPLENVRSGRLHIAITILHSDLSEGYDSSSDEIVTRLRKTGPRVLDTLVAPEGVSVEESSDEEKCDRGDEIVEISPLICDLMRLCETSLPRRRLPDPISGDTDEGETSTSEEGT